MSPVSRGRSRKKSKHGSGNRSGRPNVGGHGRSSASAGGGASAWTVLESLAGPRDRPEWFNDLISGVLNRSVAVLAARGPRELEEATAGLLGAELHRVIAEEARGLRFDQWFEHLVEAAVARIRVEAGRDGSWQAPWRPLDRLTSVGAPALARTAPTPLGHGR